MSMPLVFAISFLVFILWFISQGGHTQINLEHPAATVEDEGCEPIDYISDTNEGSLV